MALAHTIREKALELGYEECGIIPVSEVDDYTVPLQNRIERFPDNKTALEGLTRFTHLTNQFPWAKSIIVCVRSYGKYYIPENLQGLIAKYYLVDGRIDEKSPDYKSSMEFEGFLQTLKLQIVSDRKFGITALRWLALKAGLGIIRHNNFFYTEKSGSWVFLEAWITDTEMELKHTNKAKSCAVHCNACIKACPTQSLSEPFAMNRLTCVSHLTTWGGYDMPHEPLNRAIGCRIFGCDVCQDVCPYNQGTWTEEMEFPGLKEMAQHISLEHIIEMDYTGLQNLLTEKFWYIPKEKVYKWKINALNAMVNTGDKTYLPYLQKACTDENETVAAMARWGIINLKNF